MLAALKCQLYQTVVSLELETEVHPFYVEDVRDENSTQVRRNGYYIWILLLD